MNTSKISAFFSTFVIVSIVLFSCKKDSNTDNNNNSNNNNNPCNGLNLKAHPFTPVTKGEPIEISADEFQGDDTWYYWRTNTSNFESNYRVAVVTSSANFNDRGWYYVDIQSRNCQYETRDSVYVHVKFPQGAPSCSLTDNTLTYPSHIPSSATYPNGFTFVPATGFISNISGYVSNNQIDFKFNDYWNENELEDGIYTTVNFPLDANEDLDKVCFENFIAGTKWVVASGQPIYISHVNGKKRISYCNLRLVYYNQSSGQNFSIYTNGQLTER